jgi:hypothetical protein
MNQRLKASRREGLMGGIAGYFAGALLWSWLVYERINIDALGFGHWLGVSPPIASLINVLFLAGPAGFVVGGSILFLNQLLKPSQGQSGPQPIPEGYREKFNQQESNPLTDSHKVTGKNEMTQDKTK